MRHALWSLHVPQAVATVDQISFDLWNGSDRDLTVSSVVAIKSGLIAVTGILSIRLALSRSTTEGSGGTVATSEGGIGVCTISRMQQYALPTGVTARWIPTTATDGAIITAREFFPEETTPSNYGPLQFLDALLTVPQGTGIMVKQSSAASPTGVVGFQALFY